MIDLTLQVTISKEHTIGIYFFAKLPLQVLKTFYVIILILFLLQLGFFAPRTFSPATQSYFS